MGEGTRESVASFPGRALRLRSAFSIYRSAFENSFPLQLLHHALDLPLPSLRVHHLLEKRRARRREGLEFVRLAAVKFKDDVARRNAAGVADPVQLSGGVEDRAV